MPVRTTSTPRLLEPLGVCVTDSPRPTFRWEEARQRRRGRISGVRPRPGVAVTRPRPPLPARPGVARWLVEVWAIAADEDPETVMARDPLLTGTSTEPRWTVPARGTRLRAGRAYLWRVAEVTVRGAVGARSTPGLFYLPDPALPEPLRELLCCSDRGRGDISGWQAASGNPTIAPDAAGALGGAGTIRMTGSAAGGDAVTRHLTGEDMIVAGHTYQVSVALRAHASKVGYFRVRVVASSGPPAAGAAHGAPGPGVIVVADSPRVAASQWSVVVLPPWRAPRDADHLSIAAIADSTETVGATCQGLVSRVCLHEVSDCVDMGLVGSDHQFPLPASADSQVPPPASTGDASDAAPDAQHMSSDLGALVDMFGEPFAADGSLSWYPDGDSCACFGGSVPSDLHAHVPWLSNQPPAISQDDIARLVKKVLDDLDQVDTSTLQPIHLALPPCEGRPVVPHPLGARDTISGDEHPPFGGRDIVYVHGLVPGHLIARIATADPAVRQTVSTAGTAMVPADMVGNIDAEWPAQPAAFLAGTDGQPDGYFVSSAEEDYWGGHLQTYLQRHGHPNRYLVCGYNCSQRLIFAVHAVLSQIAAAMASGQGVRSPDRANDDTGCFAQEYVIVTHSTGALVINVAMAIAARTATDERLRGQFGDISMLAQRARLHVSLHGAISGSELAAQSLAGAAILEGAVAAGTAIGDATDPQVRLVRDGLRLAASVWVTNPQAVDQVDALLQAIESSTQAMAATVNAIPPMLRASILIDLSPLVAKTTWRERTADSPVPTLTVVGAHPFFGGLDISPIASKLLLPGWDDGVVSANSQAASSSLLHPDRFALTGPAARLYDMRLPPTRAASYFVEQTFHQTLPVGFAAYGASPHLSPSGMVQPVAQRPAAVRYENHFAFLQSAAEHSFPTPPKTSAPGSAVVEQNYHSILSTNYEESLVCDQADVFTTGMVHPAITGLMRRFERRLDVTFSLTIPVPVITLTPLSFRLTWHTIRYTHTLWRRLYDLLTPGAGAGLTTAEPTTATASNGILTVSVSSHDPIADALHQDAPLGAVSYAYRYVLPA